MHAGRSASKIPGCLLWWVGELSPAPWRNFQVSATFSRTSYILGYIEVFYISFFCIWLKKMFCFVLGQTTSFGSGGYIAHLEGNLSRANDMVNYLMKNSWCDAKTSAIFTEFVVYNPNVNLFCYTTMLVERFSGLSAIITLLSERHQDSETLSSFPVRSFPLFYCQTLTPLPSHQVFPSVILLFCELRFCRECNNLAHL